MNTGYIMYTVGQPDIISSDPLLSMFLIIGVSVFCQMVNKINQFKDTLLQIASETK